MKIIKFIILYYSLNGCRMPRIQACIPDIFFVNPNIWHVKVSLIVYATVDMHESNRDEDGDEHRRTQHSTRKEGDEDGGGARGKDEDDEDKNLEPQLAQINSSCNQHPPSCGAHSTDDTNDFLLNFFHPQCI